MNKGARERSLPLVKFVAEEFIVFLMYSGGYWSWLYSLKNWSSEAHLYSSGSPWNRKDADSLAEA